MTAFEDGCFEGLCLSNWLGVKIGSFAFTLCLVAPLSDSRPNRTGWLRDLAVSESVYCPPMKKPKVAYREDPYSDSNLGEVRCFLNGILVRLDLLNSSLENLLQFGEYMTHSAASKYVCLSERQLHEYKDSGRVKFARIDRKIVFRKKDLDTFVDERIQEI